MLRFSKNTVDLQQKLMNKRYTESGRGKRKKEWSYESDNLIMLDLECTSGFMDSETKKIEAYTAGKNEAYWNAKIPVCCPYIWMIAIEDVVYYGRELSELHDFFGQFPKDTHYIVYVHNLGYDFSFLQNEFNFVDVFGREERHPMRATFEKFSNIELRCSYTLTQLKLEAWGKKLGLPKAVGDLDYNKLRTPLTELTEKELFYCERDVQVMVKGIQKYTEKYLHVKDIPLTQTGEVRIPVKNMILNDKRLYNKIVKLLPKNAYMYDALKNAFAGGYTHANFVRTGEIFKGGSHYDFASSYPSVMCCEKYPMTPFIKDFFDSSKIKEKAFLMRVRYEQLRPKTYNHYISNSKCLKKSEKTHYEVDNGRIISADFVELWITEQDYMTIKETYRYSQMKIIECYSSKKEYLPKCMVSYILELYANKTQYKDVEGMEAIYNQSKQFINSMFGMCVTDFVYDETIYENCKWRTEEKTFEEVEDYLKDLKENNKNRTFLAYQWGVWITAYARRNLWKCIIPNDINVIYCDTDSIFLIGDSDFSWYNNEVTEKLKKACEELQIDFSLTHPKTPKGKEKPLGIFEKEPNWTEFITLGSKRYCLRNEETGKLELTVAGINKEAVAVLDDKIENFTEDLIFDKDAKGVNKKLVKYVDNMEETVWGDGYVSTYKHGIVMRPTSYSMSLADKYVDLLTKTGKIRNYLKCIG